MKIKLFISLIIIAAIVVGMFTWFSSNHEHDNDFTLLFSLSILLALLFTITTRLEIVRIIFATTIGVLLSIIIKIIIDWHYNPTSHNLFPFEIIIDAFLIFIVTLIGALAGALFRWIIKKRKQIIK
jgi:ammonia channel protein AmtB